MDDENKEAFYGILEVLTEKGIYPTLKRDAEGNLHADLNSHTKSGMWLYPNLVVTGRYGEHYDISKETYIDELLEVFVDRYLGKEFGDQNWIDLAIERGHLETTTITKIVRPGEG